MYVAIGCTENQDKGKNINKYDFFFKSMPVAKCSRPRNC